MWREYGLFAFVGCLITVLKFSGKLVSNELTNVNAEL